MIYNPRAQSKGKKIIKKYWFHSPICIAHNIIAVLETHSFSGGVKVKPLQYLWNTENDLNQYILELVKVEKYL